MRNYEHDQAKEEKDNLNIFEGFEQEPTYCPERKIQPPKPFSFPNRIYEGVDEEDT